MNTLLRRKTSLALLLAVAPFTTAHVAISHALQSSPVESKSWIRLQASLDKARYTVGEPIKVTLKATNVQSRDAYLKYSSGQRFELKLFRLPASVKPGAKPAVVSSLNEPVYTWSANKSFMMTTEHIKLKQGENEIYEGEIGSEMGELKAGNYQLLAQLSNSSQISAQPISFTVVPGVATPSVPMTDVAKDAPNATPDVTLRSTTDKSVYKVGEEVKVEFSLQSNAGAPVTIDFSSGQTYDVYIRNAAGEVVWNWAANKRFVMAARQVSLKAGETQEFSEKWNGRALPGYQITPGKYTVEAVYVSTPAVKAAPIEIEIR